MSSAALAQPTFTERDILDALVSSTYEKVSETFKVSRGKIYSIAVKNGARKHEQRIIERRLERKRRQEEFLSEVINATAKSDVLDYLDGLPDDSVAMHLTSPPYNVGKRYGDGVGADGQAFSYYLGWLIQCVSEMARTLQPGGVLFLQVGSTAGPDGNPYPIDALIFSHLAAMGLTFQTRIAWVIPHGLTPKRRLAERYETALVFTKGPVPRVFNPNAIRLPQKQPGKKAFKGPNKGSLSGHPLGAFPSNVWQISNAGHNRQGATGEHPAQMPAELARRAILLYSNPGDLVCDTFAGSGTTQSEAIRTGRAFTGADLFYADTRAKRLAAVAPDLVTPLTGVTDESLAVWEAEAKPVHIGARPVSSIPAQAVLI